MSETEQVVINEFTGVRTGKASASLVENIMVDVYGSNMRLREIAGITSPEPRALAIQPWDVSNVHAIEKAIQKANLGLNPTIQGKVIRIFFPELAIRHVRRDAMDQLKKHAHDRGVTEDEEKQCEKNLQKLTDDYIARIDQHLVHKEKEIMTV